MSTILMHPTASRTRRDDELVALLRAGHDAAFEQIVDRYQPALVAYARQILGGAHHDAEEAVQDAFVKALGALRRRPDAEIALKPWLYAIVKNACLDRLRKPVRTVDLEPLAPILRDRTTDPHDALVRRESLSALTADFGKLPARQRAALVMHELEGRSHEELSGRLGVSVGASKALVCRARSGLAELREAA